MPKYSNRMEDYLKTIFLLSISEKKAVVKTIDISTYLKISAPSVTEMLGKLAKQGLVNYEKYGGVTLTTKGVNLAKAVKKRQDTVESLFELLNVSEKTTAVDSCKLEHELSKETLKQIHKFLEFLKSSGNYQNLKNDFKKFRKR